MLISDIQCDRRKIEANSHNISMGKYSINIYGFSRPPALPRRGGVRLDYSPAVTAYPWHSLS
jgi:hypothetical protein